MVFKAWINLGEYTITTDRARRPRPVRRFLADSHRAADRPGRHRPLARQLADVRAAHADGQVGMARVVTDFATFAWLCDAHIGPAHRGTGLGQWLVSVV
jgi:hypothetical protein